MFLLQIKLIMQGEKRETSTETSNETCINVARQVEGFYISAYFAALIEKRKKRSETVQCRNQAVPLVMNEHHRATPLHVMPRHATAPRHTMPTCHATSRPSTQGGKRPRNSASRHATPRRVTSRLATSHLATLDIPLTMKMTKNMKM